jgi:hypothetical protein
MPGERWIRDDVAPRISTFMYLDGAVYDVDLQMSAAGRMCGWLWRAAFMGDADRCRGH